MLLRAGALAIFSLDKSREGQAYLSSGCPLGFQSKPISALAAAGTGQQSNANASSPEVAKIGQDLGQSQGRVHPGQWTTPCPSSC